MLRVNINAPVYVLEWDGKLSESPEKSGGAKELKNNTAVRDITLTMTVQIMK